MKGIVRIILFLCICCIFAPFEAVKATEPNAMSAEGEHATNISAYVLPEETQEGEADKPQTTNQKKNDHWNIKTGDRVTVGIWFVFWICLGIVIGAYLKKKKHDNKEEGV